MRVGDALRRMADAADTTGSAVKSGARAGATATRRTTGFIHRITGASGAGRTGLSTLIELSALGGAADMFVTVALAGTVFFSTSVDQARGKVIVFLLVTMAPFAVLAPFIGPFLDRMQTGRKYVLAGTLMARGLLCWGMSAAVGNTLTLLPAAFGVLVLQKAYGVVKASVTPRLLPPEIQLVTANSRSGLITLAGSTAAAGIAAVVQIAAGPAWVLRVGTVVYLAAMLFGLRLPDRIDVQPTPQPAEPADPATFQAAPPDSPDLNGQANHRQQAGQRASPGPHGTLPVTQPALPPGQAVPAGQAAQSGHRTHSGHNGARWRTLSRVGPVVAEAMAVNAVMRAFSGYILFLLAFLLRSLHFGAPHHYVSTNFKLGALAFGLTAGSLAAMAVGAMFRNRAPQLIMFTVLAASPIVAAAAAWFFGLWAAVAVEFAAIFSASLAKLAQDSIVQREIGEEIRSSTFSVSETLNQVANVAGGIAGVLVSMLNNGEAGLAIAAASLTFALMAIVSRRRRRVLAGRRSAALRGLDVVGDGPEHRTDLLRFLRVRMLAAPVGIRHRVKKLDQVLYQDDHLVWLLARLLGGSGHARHRIEQPHLQRLDAAASFSHAELHPLTLSQASRAGGQRRGMHEDLAAIIAGEKAVPLIGVVPLDLAGRHARPHVEENRKLRRV